MIDDIKTANKLDSTETETLSNENSEKMDSWTRYKAGWRPALGWLSVIIVFYSFIIHPIIVWVALWYGLKIVIPIIDATALLNLVAIVIGVGAMRSYEKVRFNETRDRDRFSSRSRNFPRSSREPRDPRNSGEFDERDDDIYN